DRRSWCSASSSTINDVRVSPLLEKLPRLAVLGQRVRMSEPAARGKQLMVNTDPEIRDALIDTVRRFVARDVISVASALEHADSYPEAIVETMKGMGLFGVTIPEAYGGLG